MPISSHSHLKRFFDICHRTAHVQQQPIVMRAGHLQPVRLRKGNNCLIILFRRAELLRELFRREILMIIGTGRVVELLEQIGQRCLIPQWQPNGQMQTFCRWQLTRWLQIETRHCRRHVPVQKLFLRRNARINCAEKQRQNQRQSPTITAEIST